MASSESVIEQPTKPLDTQEDSIMQTKPQSEVDDDSKMEKQNEKAWATMSQSDKESQEQKETTVKEAAVKQTAVQETAVQETAAKETQSKESGKSVYEKVTHRKSTDRAVTMDVDVETMQEKESRENDIAAAQKTVNKAE